MKPSSDPLRFVVHLSRERVIALLGSSARVDYAPPKREDPEEKAYWWGDQSEKRSELDRHERLILCLHLLGAPNPGVGLAFGVSRECIALRLRKHGLAANPVGTGTPKREITAQERRVPPPRS